MTNQLARRVILIGVGGFGRCWWGAVQELKLKVAAVVDPDVSELSMAASNFGLSAAQRFDGLDLTWSNVEADLVIDSAPPSGRPERIRAALLAGIDVLSAKPAAERSMDLRPLLETERVTGRKVFVAMQKRYLPAFQAAYRLLRTGHFGRIGFVGINLVVDGTSWEPGLDWRRHLAYPSLLEGAIHHIDLLRWLVDFDPMTVSAEAWNLPWSGFSSPADFVATFRGKDGCVVHYLSRWAARGGTSTSYFSGLRIEGEGGTLEIIDGKILVNGKYEAVEGDGLGEVSLDKLNVALLRNILSLPDASRHILVTLHHHKRSLSIIEAILAAIESNRAVTLEREPFEEDTL